MRNGYSFSIGNRTPTVIDTNALKVCCPSLLLLLVPLRAIESLSFSTFFFMVFVMFFIFWFGVQNKCMSVELGGYFCTYGLESNFFINFKYTRPRSQWRSYLSGRALLKGVIECLIHKSVRKCPDMELKLRT